MNKYRTFFNDNLANGEANKSYDDVCSAFNNSIFIKQFFYDFSCDIILTVKRGRETNEQHFR